MLFRQLFERDSSTYSYLLADADSREAVLIDPVRETADRDVTLIRELGLTLLATLDTHVHADHVTGASILRERLGSAVVYPASSGVTGADRLLADGEVFRFGRHGLEARFTPGHTDGCTTYVLDGGERAFTGDALLIRGCGRTDFQQGSPERLHHSVHGRIFSLPDACLIFPAHDYKGRTVTTVAEEKQHNPRLAEGRTVAEFKEIMDGLNLAYPKQIDVAVPANLKVGA